MFKRNRGNSAFSLKTTSQGIKQIVIRNPLHNKVSAKDSFFELSAHNVYGGIKHRITIKAPTIRF